MSSLSRRFSQLGVMKKFSPPSDRDSQLSSPPSPDRANGAADDENAWVPIKPPPQGLLNIVISDYAAFLDALKNADGVGIDDRKFLLEKVLVFMSSRKDTECSIKAQRLVINLLYKDLPHPPTGYLGLLPSRDPMTVQASHKRVKYAFRMADGSNNNPLSPTLGQAGSPYARSVPSTRIAPKAALPDPELVFETLLKRDSFKPHPGGLSALFFSFADLVIHCIFNTDHHDWSINNSSSYLDLSILYGNSDKEIDQLRRKDGSGKLWDDVFADSRLLFMPPASCALLVLLSRNHNYIAQKILEINENGNLQNPLPTDKDAIAEQDEEIFQRARLVNCGFFIHIILGDYVGAILGLARDGSDWRLDPLMIMRELDHDFAPTGEGNVCSLEFNQMYRWHSTLSREDTEWTGQVFNKFFDGKDPKLVTINDFKDGAHRNLPPADPREWTFGGIQRENGRFRDSDLADIIQRSTDSRAGAFKARGVPETMRIVEVMGIMQSRSWSTCSLNEFRKFMGLKPYASFAEWNPDPEIHTVAETLYKDIENLELYVGLQAEETKKPMGGAGLCPGYTLSRVILADAVALVRGDRYMTTELTPYNLTSWGYQDTRYDTEDGSYGGMLTRLLFRTLPDHYPRGSAYAHFPFLVPAWFKNFVHHQHPDLEDKYTWARPGPAPEAPLPITDFTAVKDIVNGPDFVSNYDQQGFTLVKPFLAKELSKETIKSANKPEGTNCQRSLAKGTQEITEAIFSIETQEEAAAYFTRKIEALVKQKTFPSSGTTTRYIDVVRDVINTLPVHWICRQIGLPLKTKENPSGLWTPHEAYEMFADISRYIYLNFDSSYDWHLRESAQGHTLKILESIKAHVHKIDLWFASALAESPSEGHDSSAFLKKLRQKQEKKPSAREFAAQIFLALIPTAALYSQALTHVVDYYLDHEAEGAQVAELHKSKGKDTSSKLFGYISEALRLSPPIAGVYRTATKELDLKNGVVTKAGQILWASIAKANLDADVYPGEPNYARSDADKAPIIAFTQRGLMQSKFFEATSSIVIGSVLSLPELKRAPGPSGRLPQFFEDQNGTKSPQYTTMRGVTGPWPDSLIVQYTGSKS